MRRVSTVAIPGKSVNSFGIAPKRLELQIIAGPIIRRRRIYAELAGGSMRAHSARRGSVRQDQLRHTRGELPHSGTSRLSPDSPPSKNRRGLESKPRYCGRRQIGAKLVPKRPDTPSFRMRYLIMNPPLLLMIPLAVCSETDSRWDS